MAAVFGRIRRFAGPSSRFQPARSLTLSAPLRHGGHFESLPPKSPEDVVKVNIVDRKGERHQIQGKVGDNLMYLAHRFQDETPEIYLEGACEASLACSTCHVIVEPEYFDMLPEAAEEEEDMLDQAACLKSTSRLGCQIILSKEIDGLTVTLPAYSKNFYVDGHIPQPH